MTTADEGLIAEMAGKADTADVGVVFACKADPAVTGLTNDELAWHVCNYVLPSA